MNILLKIKKITTYLIFIVGLLLILYPITSKLISSFNQTVAITNYEEKIDKMSSEEIEKSESKAQSFNNSLHENNISSVSLTEDSISSVNFASNDILAYIIIPKINVQLPIYESSSTSVLTLGIGHLSNTSLPIGGSNTHCVLVRSYWII